MLLEEFPMLKKPADEPSTLRLNKQTRPPPAAAAPANFQKLKLLFGSPISKDIIIRKVVQGILLSQLRSIFYSEKLHSKECYAQSQQSYPH
ncbi:hypothetical protein FGO68_gene642 [Halteria grandinella]|uniref:Uncharacterized protein n=1 Tax=Halteria grandinella TaxID=5974 RepID=A0A8J8NKY3_HALGN|nr:hypothetical protein FGO68_gene642 [Halteria grandinella]